MNRSSTSIDDSLFSQLSQFLSTHMGLHFPPERKYELIRGIRSASREFGFQRVEPCVRWLLSAPLGKSQIETLARYLTVGETYFFREHKMFDALEKRILPPLIRSRARLSKRLRIWSAGCCTGEEPYSIAILLTKMIPDHEEWNITIMATDINPQFLRKAREAVYRDWSFRGTPHWVKDGYFDRVDGGLYVLKQEIKKFVQFSYLNLVEDIYPSFYNEIHAMDIIFCRNVLMYFTMEQIKRAGERFFKTLMNHGWLIVGSSEASHAYFPQYVNVTFPGAILYRKDEDCREPFKIYIPESEPVKENLKEPIKTVPSKSGPVPTPVQSTPLKSESRREKTVPEKTVSDNDSSLKKAERFYQKGFYEETIQSVDLHSVRSSGNTDAMVLISKAFANQGRIKEALDWCNQAIGVNKLDPSFYHLKAVIYQEEGNIDQASAALKKALYLDPEFILAYFTLGHLTLQQGKTQESQKHFDNAFSLLETHDQDDSVPGSEGMTVGRLREIIQFVKNGELA